VILADVNSQDPAQVTAALQHGYVIGGWIAMILHALGTELYVSSPSCQTIRRSDADQQQSKLYLTAAESVRLRAVSKHRKAALAGISVSTGQDADKKTALDRGGEEMCQGYTDGASLESTATVRI